MASTSKRRATLCSLPTELVLYLSEFLCESSFLRLASASARFHTILSRPSLLFTVAPRTAQQDINVKQVIVESHDASGPAVQLVEFSQDTSKGDLHYPRIDSVVDIPGDSSDNGGRQHFVGLRRKGDRTVISRLPLGAQKMVPPQHTLVDDDLDPATCSLYASVYFEVTVESYEVEASMRDTLPMHIGLAVMDGMKDHVHPPGSVPRSIGYRSSDGYIVMGDHYGEQFQFAPPWSQGDTVGCGYVKTRTQETVYFTLNGVWVGDAPSKILVDAICYRQCWHACVSSSYPAKLTVNHGQVAFKFKMGSDYVARHLLERARLEPTFEELLKIQAVSKQTPIQLDMQANVLPRTSDPYPVPEQTVSGETGHTLIDFPFVSATVSRSMVSLLPFGYMHTNMYESHPCQYFEATVTRVSQNNIGFVSIGLVAKHYSSFHQIGWDDVSIGVHSDDGRLFFGSHQDGCEMGMPFGVVGATVGCGYIPLTGTVFFTRNGVLMRDVPHVVKRRLYAAVGAIGDWQLSLNFGQSAFRWQGK